jgi:hypothetical protein
VVRKLILLVGLVVVVSAVATSTASATTFSGDCSWDGTLYFETPFKFVPSYNTYDAQGNGTCKGKLNGAAYNGPATLTFHAHMNQPMSCELGIPINLPEKITFASSPDIATAETLDMIVTLAPHVLNGELLHYTGVYNGHGYGTALWHVQNSDIDACLGSGLPHEDFTTTLSTITTLYG